MGKAYWPSTIYLREHAFSVVPCFISQVTICVWDFLQFQPNIRVMSGLFFIDCIFPWEWATFSWYLCMLSSYEFRMLNTMNATKNLGNKSSMLHDLEKHLSSAPHIMLYHSWIWSFSNRFKAQNNSSQIVKPGSILVETIQSNMVSLPCPTPEFSPIPSLPWLLSPRSPHPLPFLINLALGHHEVQYLIPHYGS